MTARLFVGNLHYDVQERELFEFLESLSLTVENVKILYDKETGASRGFGFVEVQETLSTAQDIARGAELRGRPLRIEEGIRKEQARK